MDFTSTALLASIRRRAMLPSATADGTADSDLLALANEELQNRLVADIMAIREEYFVRYIDTTLVSGRTEYRIPKRAVGGVLRDVALVDANSNILRLPRISPEAIDRFDASTNPGNLGYIVRGNSVVLLGSSTSWPTLRMFFFVRPSEIITTATAGTGLITAINTSTNTVTLTSTIGLTSGALDLVAATPGFEHLVLDQTPSSTTATTIVFPSTLPVVLAVGDWVTLADKTVVPNIPAEWHPVLAQRVAVKVLEAMGDTTGMVNAQRALLEMEEKAKVLAAPRVQGSLEKIVNRNSGIRSRGLFRRRW